MKTKNNVLKVHFYLKKNEADTIGNCPLMGRITIGQSMVQFSLKCNFSSNLWDTRNGKASGKSKSALELNNKLDKIRISINNHYRILREHKGPDTPITAHEIKNAFQGIAGVQQTLLKFFDNHNREFQKCIGINRQASTVQQYEISLKHLTRFIRLKYKLSDIPFSQLDLSFIEGFDFYLRIELKRMSNTILGITRHLRKMIKLAIAEDIITSDPFEAYTPERPKARQKYLTREELDRIINTQLDHPCRYLTRDMFLFSCFTGIAFRDMCNLTDKELVKEQDGELWIKTFRQKTGTPAHIPLLPIPLQILEKYRGIAENNKLLPMLSCGRLNKNLKVIGKLCNIERRLIFHMGRHTYASEICLSQGVPIESVSRMLGHRDLRSTQIYAKITDDKIAEDMQNLETRLKGKYNPAI